MNASFKKLCLGAKFQYEAGQKTWVKVGANTIAEWDESQLDTNWVGQQICCFAEDDRDTDQQVVVVDSMFCTDTFWKRTIESVMEEDGVTAAEAVRRELSDFHDMIERFPKIIDHATGGKLSKLNYTPEVYEGAIDDHITALVEEAVKDHENDREPDDVVTNWFPATQPPITDCNLIPDPNRSVRTRQAVACFRHRAWTEKFVAMWSELRSMCTYAVTDVKVHEKGQKSQNS
jgi:hypothetical protein